MSDYGFLVVARYRDGKTIRGCTGDFRPDRALFSIVDEQGKPIRVVVEELKALFFVKSLFGDHAHQEKNTFRYRKGVGKKVWVEFLDGEQLAGWTVSYDPAKGGFFLFPTDPSSNLEKVWIVLRSTLNVLTDAQALAADQQHEEGPSQRARHRSSPDRWDELLGLKPADYRRSEPAKPPPDKPDGRRDSGLFLGDW